MGAVFITHLKKSTLVDYFFEKLEYSRFLKIDSWAITRGGVLYDKWSGNLKLYLFLLKNTNVKTGNLTKKSVKLGLESKLLSQFLTCVE